MKVVVIGGSGLIGSKVVEILKCKGIEVVSASAKLGVNTKVGLGLDKVLRDANVVIDLANSPSFEAKVAMDFFTTSTRNILRAATSAGIDHFLGLSVVGAERLTNIGYFRAKNAQEELIRKSSVPYSILHSTQSFEFLETIARSSTNDGDVVILPQVYFQPIASDDIADAVAEAALRDPVNGVIEIAGPKPLSLPEIMQRYLNSQMDPRIVGSDIHAPYFGGEIYFDALMPSDKAMLGLTPFESWLKQR